MGDDDYIFAVQHQGVDVYVSQFMIIYFCAALCFILSGLLDFIRRPGILGFILVLAGSFGMASACLVEKDERLATIFNSVSVHLFLTEAIGLFFQNTRRSTVGKRMRYFLSVGDFSWVLGAFIDVFLSYFHLGNNFNLGLSKLGIFAACLWLLFSLIHTTGTLYKEFKTPK